MAKGVWTEREFSAWEKTKPDWEDFTVGSKSGRGHDGSRAARTPSVSRLPVPIVTSGDEEETNGEKESGPQVAFVWLPPQPPDLV
jgi:hypothetical protein